MASQSPTRRLLPPRPARRPLALCAAVLLLSSGIATFQAQASPAGIRIDAGASKSYIDHTRAVWSPEQLVASPGSTEGGAVRPGARSIGGAHGGSVTTSRVAIARTRNDALYASAREGMTSWSVPVAKPGIYRVKLLFAETRTGARGARVFDVDAENAPYLRRMDIVALTGGKNVATHRTKHVTVRDHSLDLEFTSHTALPAMVSAIELVWVADAPAEPASP